MEADNQERCFVCGAANPVGLGLSFWFEGEQYCTSLAVQEQHQGYAGLLHGGITATVLDEVMARLLWVRGIRAIPAQLEVRYLRPVRVGERLTFRGRLLSDRGKLVETEAVALGADGQQVARAVGKALLVERMEAKG